MPEQQPAREGMYRLQTRIPWSWKDRLDELAAERAVSIGDVVRIFLRDSLYERPLPRRREP